MVEASLDNTLRTGETAAEQEQCSENAVDGHCISLQKSGEAVSEGVVCGVADVEI